MAQVTKGKTFVSGETVTPPKLNDLVDNATVTGIVNADLDAAAAIEASKLQNPQYTGFRNEIINGNFAINQRVVAGTVTLAAGAYGHDRWKAGASGCTYTFATSGNVTTLTISAGSIIQVIEGSNLYDGTYVLSWTGTAQGKIGAGSFSATGVTGPATGGTNLSIEFNTGTVSLVQLELGSVATPFERRPIGTELALCQRYYEIGRNLFCSFASALPGLTDVKVTSDFKVTKRAAPNVTATTTGAPITVASSSATVDSIQVNYTAGINNNFSANWTASAEL